MSDPFSGLLVAVAHDAGARLVAGAMSDPFSGLSSPRGRR